MTRAERVAGGVALCLAVLHVVVRPDSGTDLAAQLARMSFARSHPFTPVDFSWYGGVHPFGYSLLSPWVMALLGVKLAGILAAVGGAVLFARLTRDLEHPMLTGVIGAFFSVADVVSGRTTFALAAVAALGALLARERPVARVVLGVVTSLLSPVAGAFLGFSAAVLVLHRRPGGWSLGLSVTVPVLVLGVLFPGGGVQPFSPGSAVPAVGVALVLALITSEPMVRTGSLLYAVAIVFFVIHEDPFGSNVLRLGLLVAGALAVATSRRHAVLCAVAAGAFLSWQVDPMQGDLNSTYSPAMKPLVSEFQLLGAKRVEVVAPREHRESSEVAEHVPIARGWSRQIDYRDNRLFYEDGLSPEKYVAWLRDNGVDHVAVPRGRIKIDFGSIREAKLLQTPVRGLTQVWQNPEWTVFRVVDAPGIARGARVTRSTRTEVAVTASAAGDVPMALRWSRWLSVTGDACLEEHDGRATLVFGSAGDAVVSSSLTPSGHC